MTRARIRYLLLQVRNDDDPMVNQEIRAFAEVISSDGIACDVGQIDSRSLLRQPPTAREMSMYDVVLIGGSGDYSAAGQGDWLHRSMDTLRELYELKLPTFASCWGFQAMARALGGKTIHDPDHAELGTSPARLTPAGQSDPVFSVLPNPFDALQGHEDRVLELPPAAILLASTEKVAQQAFTFADRPLYATQFHPELTLRRYIERLRAYPRYVTKITGLSFDEFVVRCRETPEANRLLPRFLQVVLEID